MRLSELHGSVELPAVRRNLAGVSAAALLLSRKQAELIEQRDDPKPLTR